MLILKVILIRHASSQRKFLRALHRYGSIALNKELMKPEKTDSIIQGIKSATNTLDLLDVLSKNHKPLTSEQVVLSLKSIFLLEKSENSVKQKSEIVNHPQFEQLLCDLRRTSRTLPLNDIIEALKILAFIGIPANANITYVLLNFLRRQINDVTLGHIVFLDFLLNKYEKTPLIEALQIALPIIFQLQLQYQMDHENVPQLIELLLFASRHRISNQCIMNIISALTLHGTKISLEEARSIVWSLSDLHTFKPAYVKLLENCFKVINKHYINFSYENIDSTLTKIANKCFYNNFIFYNEEFFNKCASYVIEMDVGFEKAIYVLKKFNKINFVNIPLLDYIAEEANKNRDYLEKAKPLIYFHFVSGFSNANYIPKQWSAIETSILSNPILKSDRMEFSWLKFVAELISLNTYNSEILEKVLNDNFLEKYLAKESNTLNYLQLLLLHQYVSILAKHYNGPLPSQQFIDRAIEINFDRRHFPLKASLEFIFKNSSVVCTKMATKYGHLIDHVIVFDKENEPIAVNFGEEDSVRYVEDLQNDNRQIVAILAFPKTHYALNIPRLKSLFELKLRTLEALGIKAVPVNLDLWTQLPDKEKLPYLEREIRYRLEHTHQTG